MMKPEQHFVEAESLSLAWAEALHLLVARHGEMAPLVVSITGFDDGIVRELPPIRETLDALLATLGKQSCHTVANTIFPESLWDPTRPRADLFARYERLLPRLHSLSPKNRRGLYFERLIQGGPQTNPNQLDFILTAYGSRRGVRRSVLQLSVFSPQHDHSTQARQGFPCLQHVTFAPHDGGLTVNAFYAMHYFVERAYGNYLGLCRLGRFVAHELGLPLIRMTCFSGIALLDVDKRDATGLLRATQEAFAAGQRDG